MLFVLALLACSGDTSDDTNVDTNNPGDMSLDELIPANDAVDVQLDTPIVAVFDRDLATGDLGVIGQVGVSGIDGSTLTTRLSQPLQLLTTYTVATQNITAVDGSTYGNAQFTFTTRDGEWGDTNPVTAADVPTGFASATLGTSTVVLITRADRTEAFNMTAIDPNQTTVLDELSASSDPWIVANDTQSLAIWLQDDALYTAAGTQEGVWSEPRQATDSSFLLQPTGLAMTEDGTAAAAWRSSSVRTRVATRVDGVWSSALTLGCGPTSECTSLALYPDHTGGISAMIRGLSADGAFIETSAFHTGEWTTPEVLFSVDGDIAEPVLAQQTGETLAIWRVNDSVDAGLFMSRMSSDGTWSDSLQVRDGVDISTLDMVARADGGWTTAWVEVQSDNDGLSYGLWVSGIEQTALADPFRLVESFTSLRDVDLAADAGGNLHLTWIEESEPSRLMTRRFNHQTGWEEAVELATSARIPHIGVLPGNAARAVFAQDDQVTTVEFE